MVWAAGGAAHAQEASGVWIDASASHARPPAGAVEADPASYGLLGVRGAFEPAPGVSLSGGLHGGRAASTAGGTWFTGTATADVTRRLGPVSLGGAADAFGLSYTRPFRYSGYGVGVRPRVAAPVGPLVVSIVGDVRRGRWQSGAVTEADDLPGPNPPFGGVQEPATAEADGPLRVTGARIDAGTGIGPGWLRATGEMYDAVNGAVSGVYRGVGAELTMPLGPATASLAARWWQSPDTLDGVHRSETGFRAAVQLPLDRRLTAHAELARSVSDPWWGARGAVATSIGLSWRFGADDGSAARPVAAVVSPASDASRVRFFLRAPDAAEVAIAGSFSDWQPLPMRADGDGWTLELMLEPGLYHFAFVVDGEWHVPEGAPGVSEDGWGRRNASIVVEQE